MGVLPARPDRDRDRRATAHTAAAAAEGPLTGHDAGPGRGERSTDLRDQLARVGREVVRAGLVVGSGGNLSARHPGAGDCWVTAAGSWLDRLDRAAFVRVRIADGAPADQPAPADEPAGAPAAVPSSELALHLHTYRIRPDVNVVLHLHPQSVLLLDALGERIRLVTTDHAYYVRQVARVGFHPPGSVALAAAAAEAVADGVDCVILAHHGCSVLGDSVELAHKRVRNLEEAALLSYRALALGRTDLLECPPVSHLRSI